MDKLTDVADAIQPSRTFLDVRPVVARGLRREHQRRARKRARIPGGTLIVGIDLARERQAVSYCGGGEILGRRRFDCSPDQLDRFLPEGHAFARERGLSGVVVAFEAAGHYWKLAAEAFERAGVDYVLVHSISVKRERESTRYTPEKMDPRDADLIALLAGQGKFMEVRLPQTRERAALWELAQNYGRIRRLSAAERTRLHNFWHRMLPEFFTVLRDVSSATALSVARALLPLSELSRLSSGRWLTRVRRAAQGQRILKARAAALFPLLHAAHTDPVRRSGEGMPMRIRHAAERRCLLELQKSELRVDLLSRYRVCPERIYLDSIEGSDPFYNALVLALVGDFADYDDPRAIVKLAGTEVNQYSSGDWEGTSRMSHRGRSALRAAAYQQARNLVSNNPDYRARFYHLIHRTDRRRLVPLQAYVAILNSYLRTAHALVVRQQVYQSRTVREEVVH